MCEWNITTVCVVPRALKRALTIREIISCLFHTSSHHYRNFSEMSNWSRSRKSPLLISASESSSGDYIWLSVFKTQAAAAALWRKWRIGVFHHGQILTCLLARDCCTRWKMVHLLRFRPVLAASSHTGAKKKSVSMIIPLQNGSSTNLLAVVTVYCILFRETEAVFCRKKRKQCDSWKRVRKFV